MANHNAIYTEVNGVARASFNGKDWYPWQKRWFKTFDVAFGVSASLEHLTLQGDEYIFAGDTKQFKLVADTGYTLPETVDVTGATAEYADGIITISNAESNVTISASATEAVQASTKRSTRKLA